MAISTRNFCSAASWRKNRALPKTRATIARVNMLTMLAPRMLPPASSGWLRLAAVMLVTNSGREVATATRIVPTHSLPQPISPDRRSPYLARKRPLKMTNAELPANRSSAWSRSPLMRDPVGIRRHSTSRVSRGRLQLGLSRQLRLAAFGSSWQTLRDIRRWWSRLAGVPGVRLL